MLDYHEYARRGKMMHRALMKATDCRKNMRYLRSKLDTIQVTGTNNGKKGGNRSELKHLEHHLLQDYFQKEDRIQAAQIRASSKKQSAALVDTDKE